MASTPGARDPSSPGSTARVQASIITISAAIGDWLVRTERLPAEKRRVVHYALDGEQFRSAARSSAALSSGAPLVGTVSRLLSQKRVDVLLRAVACCVSRHPKVALVIVGEGPERGRLERLSTELGIADRVSFLGHRDDVSGLMRGLDIFALPSSGEGFGLVVLEAYAWSKPVVVSDVLALPEIVESERTGLLVPPGDVGELAGAIDRLAADLNLRQQLGTAGRQRLERDFTVDRMVAATAAVYEDVRSPRRCAVIRRW